MADKLVVIADDYGLGDAHDAAMRRLLHAGAIDAVSVLVEFCSPQSAEALARVPGIRVGLHLNLTLTPPGASPRPGRDALLLGGLVGRHAARARAGLEAQWAAFIRLFGRAPDFIDGHEHCHAFPTIRQRVLEKAARDRVPVRSLVPLRAPEGLKERVLAYLGTGLARRAAVMGVDQNWRFCGVLPLKAPEAAIAALEAQLRCARAAAAAAPGEIWMMVHPGARDDPTQIAGHAAHLRAMEYDLLMRMRLTD